MNEQLITLGIDWSIPGGDITVYSARCTICNTVSTFDEVPFKFTCACGRTYTVQPPEAEGAPK